MKKYVHIAYTSSNLFVSKAISKPVIIWDKNYAENMYPGYRGIFHNRLIGSICGFKLILFSIQPGQIVWRAG